MAMRPSTLKLDEYLWNGDLDMDEEDDEWVLFINISFGFDIIV